MKTSGANWLQSRVDYPLSVLAQKVADIMSVVFSGLYNWDDCQKMKGWQAESCILLPIEVPLTTGNLCPSLTALVLVAHKYGVEVSVVPMKDSVWLRFVDAPEQPNIQLFMKAIED